MAACFFTQKLKRRLIVCLIGIIVMIVSITAVFIHGDTDHIEYNGKSISLRAESIQDQREFASEMGIKLSENPVMIQKVRIPERFSKVYNEYNEEQKKAGFDLTEYKGKKCTLYTYAIKNLIESRKEFYDILISDGKIIGTDKIINRTLS